MTATTQAIAPRVLVQAIVVGVVLVFFQGLMLYPLERSMDLPTWDESNQMGWGAEFASGSGTLQNLSSSPLYNLQYALLTRAFGRIGSIFAAKYVITVGTSLLLYAFLLCSTRSGALSLLLSVAWIVSRVNLSATLYVYHFALLIFLLALLSCNRSKLLAIVLLFLCALARLEYLLVLLPYAGYSAWSLARRRPEAVQPGSAVTQARRLVIVAVALASVLAIYTSFYVDGWGVGGRRTWHAFRQHYALAEVQAGRADIDPWIDYDTVIARDFPDSGNTVEALASNPRAFALHIARNTLRLPGSALKLFEPYRHRSYWPLHLAVLVLLASGPVAALTRRRRPYLASLRKRITGLRDVAVLGSLAPLALIPGLLVWSKASYSLPLVPVLLLAAGIAIAAVDAGAGTGDPPRTRRRERLFAIVAIVVVVFYALMPRPFDRTGRRRPVYERVTALRAIWPETELRFLGVGASWYANYLGRDRCVPIEPLPSVAGEVQRPDRIGLDALIEAHRPDAVLINRTLLHSRHFEASSLSVLTPGRWRQYPFGDEAIFFALPD